MIDFLTWSLLVVGVTYAVTTSFVLALPRILFSRLGLMAKYFIYCPWCVSFWVGALTEPFFSLEAPWTITWIGNAITGGFVAMGLISVLKAAFPTLLVPPFEAEQGAENVEAVVVQSNEKGPDQVELGGPNGQPWFCSRCNNGPLKYGCRSYNPFGGGVCDLCLVSDEVRKECPHRYTNVGSDRRCILCGADEA